MPVWAVSCFPYLHSLVPQPFVNFIVYQHIDFLFLLSSLFLNFFCIPPFLPSLPIIKPIKFLFAFSIYQNTLKTLFPRQETSGGDIYEKQPDSDRNHKSIVFTDGIFFVLKRSMCLNSLNKHQL